MDSVMLDAHPYLDPKKGLLSSHNTPEAPAYTNLLPDAASDVSLPDVPDNASPRVGPQQRSTLSEGDERQAAQQGSQERLPASESLDQDFSESSSPAPENSSASHDNSGSVSIEDGDSRTDLDSLSEQSKSFYNSHQLSKASIPKQEISYTASGKERKRRQILPKIAKEDRCGTCHHCMNPKLKKACITARKLQMKSLDEQEELPLFYKIASNKLNSKAVPLTKPKAPQSNDIRVTTEQIQGLLVQVDNQVTIKPGKQQHFLDLLSKPQEGWGTRIFFMTVISMLPLADRTMLVKQSDFKGLHVLHNWLNKAKETQNAEKFQLDVLAALGALPVDMEALRKVPIGKTANGLAKKDSSAKVRSAAAALVQQWRRNVGMPQTDVKRARDADTADGVPNKKLKSDLSGSGELPKKSSADSFDLVQAAAADSSNSASSRKASDGKAAVMPDDASINGHATPLPMEVDDDAMFEKKPQKPVKAEPAQAHKVQRLDLQEVAKLSRGSDVSATASHDIKQEEQGSQAAANGPATSKDKDSTAAGPSKSRLGSAASAPSALGSLSTGVGGSTRIGGLGSIGLSSLGTFSGLSRQPLGIRTAADRAAEAAARIPEPPPRSPKRKLKSVSFVEDGELTHIRYFLKTEPAVAVKADPDFTAAESTDAAALQQNAEQPSEDHPPEFKSAARREHADEAAAIRHNMQSGAVKQEEEEQNEAMDAMVPTWEMWVTPPLNPPLAPGPDPVALGEESQQCQAEASRIQHFLPFPQLHPHDLPDEPSDDLVRQEPDPSPASQPPRIQLFSPAELQAQQSQQAPPPQQHPQQPAHGPQGLPQPAPSLQGFFGSSQPPPPPQAQQGYPSGEPLGMAPRATPGAALQQPGVRPPAPVVGSQYPAPQAGLQHQLPHQMQPRPNGPPGVGPFSGGPPAPPSQPQGPAIMRPMQHHPGGPPSQLAGAPALAPAGAQDHEIEHPTAARPGGPVCKFFNTPHGCIKGNRCGFRHVSFGPPPASRPADSAPRPQREPQTQGRGRTFLESGNNRPIANHSEGTSWQNSRPCMFFNKPGGCNKGDRCPFMHVRDEEWVAADARSGRAISHVEHRDRDRSLSRPERHSANRKSSGWDQGPNA